LAGFFSWFQLLQEFPIGLCGVVEADWELFCNCCWSARFLEELLYTANASSPRKYVAESYDGVERATGSDGRVVDSVN